MQGVSQYNYVTVYNRLIVTNMYQVKVFLGLCGILVVGITIIWFEGGDIASYSYKLSDSWGISRHLLIKRIFKERTDRVREVCAAEKSKVPENVKIIARTWSIERRHKMLMCRTAKHGSTTWAYNFVMIYSNG